MSHGSCFSALHRPSHIPITAEVLARVELGSAIFISAVSALVSAITLLVPTITLFVSITLPVATFAIRLSRGE
jgi:hypothetical protein